LRYSTGHEDVILHAVHGGDGTHQLQFRKLNVMYVLTTA
jgi:hypothetical protein